MKRFGAFLCVLLLPSVAAFSQQPAYPWMAKHNASDTIASRIPTPNGYTRAKVEPDSFAHWLRHLPLKKDGAPVLLHNGKMKSRQDVHFAVIDMDVGEGDLQQCADAIIRLRAEYLYAMGDHRAIHFNFTSGDRADFAQWVKGYRPTVAGNRVTWSRSAQEDSSYPSFRKYLDTVFAYAGSLSLSGEMHGVPDLRDMRIGDVFIEGGSPGHAVIVVDIAADQETGSSIFLLAQSYMPAQDIHILKNTSNAALSPWYDVDFGEHLVTPQWTFRRSDLKRF